MAKRKRPTRPAGRPPSKGRKAVFYAEQQRRAARRRRATVAAVVVLGLAVLVAVLASAGGNGGNSGDEVGGAAPEGVATFEVTEQNHVPGTVDYPQTPPVGGDHAPVWQNCGFYDESVVAEQGVHSLEHGAVWITYRPDLPASDQDELRALADRQTFVLVTPFEDLPAPIVASAWGRQLRLDAAGDPALAEFVRAFRQADSAPEPGAPCTGGEGTPG